MAIRRRLQRVPADDARRPAARRPRGAAGSSRTRSARSPAVRRRPSAAWASRGRRDVPASRRRPRAASAAPGSQARLELADRRHQPLRREARRFAERRRIRGRRAGSARRSGRAAHGAAPGRRCHGCPPGSAARRPRSRCGRPRCAPAPRTACAALFVCACPRGTWRSRAPNERARPLGRSPRYPRCRD